MEDLWKDITLSTLTSTSSPTTILQDFLTLAGPFSSKTNPLSASSVSNSTSPQTILTLNKPHFQHHVPDYTSPNLDNSGSSGSKCSCDPRHKRMIKNRESAARSRARKQAYTTELELEVAQLKQENARLKMEQEIRNKATLDKFPKKHKLHRTLTSPF